MHLTAPLYTRSYINREYSKPSHSQALFGSRYWLTALIFSITMHVLIMHGLPWMHQSKLPSNGIQSMTADFKVLPSPVPATLPEIAPVPETPITPIKSTPKKISKPKPIQKTPPNPEPILQSEAIAQPEDFAITAQTSDVEEVEVTEETTETIAPETVIEETQTVNAPATQQILTQATPATSDASSARSTLPTTQTTTSSQDNGVLDAYGKNLQRLCEKNKQYPAIAIRRNLEGAGSVLVQFNAAGEVLSISIEHSTGQSVLDQQAIEMVEKSLASLPLPSKLRGRVLILSVPIAFSLDG